MKNLKTTHAFIILDEEDLRIVKGKNNQTLIFNTHQAANNWASGNLGLWQIIEMNFNHDWVQHKANNHLFG